LTKEFSERAFKDFPSCHNNQKAQRNPLHIKTHKKMLTLPPLLIFMSRSFPQAASALEEKVFHHINPIASSNLVDS
jgi:hypothetical protein